MTRSLLDTDLYKLTMQNAVRALYPEATATYRLTNRTSSMRFNEQAFQHIQEQIKQMDDMRLTEEERQWLQKTCPYFSEGYLKWLTEFRLDSAKEVKIAFKKDESSEFGELDIESALSPRMR